MPAWKKEQDGQQKGKNEHKEAIQRHGLQFEQSGDLGWAKSCQGHPRNWSTLTKLYAVVIVSWLELYMTAISGSGASTSDAARMEYGLSRTLSYFAFLTLYLLGQTIGGIFCSPMSEAFGRRTIYIIAAGLFCVSSLVVGLPHSPIAVYIGRFVQGVAAAIPATVAFGTFADLYDAYSRIWIVFAYTFAGMVGLAAGPIFAAFVTEYAGWRWVYHISAIVSFVSAVLSFFMKESNAQQLLEARVKAFNKETGENFKALGSSNPSIKDFAKDSLFRPVTFLVTEPIVLLCAILCAIAFGLIYGLTESITIVYTAAPFNFSMTNSSLAFVAIIIGEGINVLPRIYDHHIMIRYRNEKKRILPEIKIRSFALACPALAIGLWLFAWTIPDRVTDVPWPVSMIGLGLIGFAANDFSYTLFGYATDAYGEYAASAVAAVSLTRTLAAAVFPLFTHQMYTGLGNNIATSILAAVSTLFAFTPILFIGYGARLRKASKVAPDDEDAMPEENAHMKDGQTNQNDRNASEDTLVDSQQRFRLSQL